MTTDNEDIELREAIEKAAAESERIIALDYDGVAGTVPEYFAPFDIEFYDIRNQLLHKYNEEREEAKRHNLDNPLTSNDDGDAHQDILNYMKWYEENNKPGMHIYDVEPDYKHLHYVPIEDEDKIAFLCKMKRAVRLGRIEGMRLLAGDNAARGAKAIVTAKLGHEEVYGTSKEKEQLWKEYQSSLIEVHKKHPNWKLTAIRQQVAEDYGVSLKTIQRHTQKTW